MTEKTNRTVGFALLSLLCGYVIFVFYPALKAFFDPQDFISFLNPLATGTPLGRYMVESWSWVNENGQLIGFFRPLISTTFLVEYPLFGINPLGYKLVNMGMHLLCAFFVGRAVMQLTGRKRLSFFAGALFALHPGTVVATGMIVSRHDVLVCLFSVLALSSTYSLSRTPQATWKAVLPALFVFLAVNSKELGMMNLVALPIMYFLWPGRKKCAKNTYVFLASLIFVEFVYIAAREMIFGNIGGYGAYTAMSAVPSHIATIISQATGAYYLGNRPLRIVIYLLVTLIILNYTRTKPENWRKAAAALLVTGAYSAQSVISDVATHYVYTAAAFTVIFLVVFAGAIPSVGRHGKRVLTVVAAVVLAASGLAARAESLRFHDRYLNGERVYRALEEIAPLLPTETGSVCFVQTQENPAVGREMKNVGLYMVSVDPTSRCEFLPLGGTRGHGDIPVLVWEGDGIVEKRDR